MDKIAYAIDFGTSNSIIAAVSRDNIEILPICPNASDPTILKSIFFTPEVDKWFFGTDAIAEYSESFNDGRLLRSLKKFLPDATLLQTNIHGKVFTLIDLISLFLKEVRYRANKLLNQDITNVVLGRPAAFSLDSNVDALAENRLRAAAKLAGFKEIVFLPEPIAAAFDFRQQVHTPQTVLVADFGGGTSDFTVLRMNSAGFKLEDILAINGVSTAGDNFDGSLMRHNIAPYFGSQISYKLPLGNNILHLPQNVLNKMCSAPDISFLGKGDLKILLEHAKTWSLSKKEQLNIDRLFILAEEHLGYKLFEAIEKVKIALSSSPSATFAFHYPDLNIEENISQHSFAQGSKNIVNRIMATLDQCVANANLTHKDIDLVCLTGGTAKIPEITNSLIERFGKDLIRNQSQFHSVVGGLALKAKEIFC